MIATIHLILYATGEPFATTQALSAVSVQAHSKYPVRVHALSLAAIQARPWFAAIADYPRHLYIHRRDGYFNAWKPFICADILAEAGPDDIILYVDCSKYFVEGFTESIDRLCEYAYRYECVAGAVADNVRNCDHFCLTHEDVWRAVWPGCDTRKELGARHILNSMFAMRATQRMRDFVAEWAAWVVYQNPAMSPLPFVALHHTVDQSIFGILARKWRLPVFYWPAHLHDDNKCKNRVLHMINSCSRDEELEHLFLVE